MFKKLVILFILLMSFQSFAVMPNHCERFSANSTVMQVLESLSHKLSYSFDELCTLGRIADIYQETRSVYIREKDVYQDHLFVTLHYYEYSCEYQFNLVENKWGNQSCYNTW